MGFYENKARLQQKQDDIGELTLKKSLMKLATMLWVAR
jgi:hypothetical protein